MKNTSKGLSIVELLIVIAIMSVIVTVIICVSRMAPHEDHNVCVATYKDSSTENLQCLGAYTDEPIISGSAKNLVGRVGHRLPQGDSAVRSKDMGADSE